MFPSVAHMMLVLRMWLYDILWLVCGNWNTL